MRTFLRINNILLIIAMIGCCAGALAGLIVLFPFAAGAWALNLVGLLGFEEGAGTERPRPAAAEPSTAPEQAPVTSRESRGSVPVTHGI
jgi:hypothetical protein